MHWSGVVSHKLLKIKLTPLRCNPVRESHYLWGKRCLLHVVEGHEATSIEMQHNRLLLRVPPGTTEERKQEIVAQWYRNQLRAAVPILIVPECPGRHIFFAKCSILPQAFRVKVGKRIARVPGQ